MTVSELHAFLQNLVDNGYGDKLVQLEIGHDDVIERQLLRGVDNSDNVTTLILSAESLGF